MIARIIELSARRPWIVFGVVAALAGWAIVSVRETPSTRCRISPIRR
ncbi:MAG: hypothetical protein M5U28_55190 [Sandaracinaceae bacterium]|nr:hypothetical protein [Sandaracinaceae bacterium]